MGLAKCPEAAANEDEEVVGSIPAGGSRSQA
jgi:hypothetical protein